MPHHYITLASLYQSSDKIHYVAVKHFVVECFYLKTLRLKCLQLFK